MRRVASGWLLPDNNPAYLGAVDGCTQGLGPGGVRVPGAPIYGY